MVRRNQSKKRFKDSASSNLVPSVGDPRPFNPFPVVGIGASAGGLEAFTQLLSQLPPKTGMAFLLVQHLDPDHPSMLTDLLAKATSMPVRAAKNGMGIRPNEVFIIPPKVNMALVKGKLRLTPRENKNLPTLPVNHLFYSLAREQQSWAIGVVLSGTGSDGALGLAEIKEAGGLTFAQDVKSARFAGMPTQAGNVDFILRPEKIAEELARIGQDPYLMRPLVASAAKPEDAANDLRRILAILRSHTHVDFSLYRDSTIKRRIERRMVVNHCVTLPDYIRFLEKNPAEPRSLFGDVLINVTSFFRDPEMFEELKLSVFPKLLKKSPDVIRIWVTACSTGQEAYSLAITLLEFLENKRNVPAIQIFATDINETAAIEKAQRGLFPPSIEAEMSPERLRRWFTKEAGGYRISKGIRELCVFAKHNIAGDPPFSRMDLVSCRNLLIYFTPPLQRRVLSTFHYALNPEGFLVLGSAESVGSSQDMFNALDRRHKIFSKKNLAVRPFGHFTTEDLKAGTLALSHPSGARAPAPADFQREADRILLGRFAPAAVLINSSLEVLHFRGRTGRYLEAPSGPASLNILKMARENLVLELGKAIAEARRKNAPVRRLTRMQEGKTMRPVNLEIMPVKLAGSAENCFLVLFEEGRPEPVLVKPAAKGWKNLPKSAVGREADVTQLQGDLKAAREYLQAVVEQHEASNEELKCANEEVLSSNEELQSMNEQLGTAKEELQSTNEELVTLNEELQTRNTDVTQANNALKIAQSELTEYVKAIVDTVRGPFLVLNETLHVQTANPAFYKMFETSAAETEQHRIFELGNGQWNIPKLCGNLTSILDGKFALKDFEVVENFPRVGRRAMRLNARRLEQKTGVEPMILLSIEDVTELKQTEEVNRWLAAIVESSDDAIVGQDLDGKIASCNRGAAKLYGYAPEELVGQHISILIPADCNHEETQILQRIRRDERIEHYECARQRKDGTRLELSLSVSPVKDMEGKIIGASNIARDISARKEAEKNLAESLAREKTTREAAEAASRAKDDFLAALSHELRTPLNPVLLLASDSARNTSLPPRVRKDFEIIRKNVELEARLIDDLLDITSITFGKLSLDLRVHDLRLVLKDAVAAMKSDAAEKKIQLKLKLAGDPLPVNCDAVRLQQIFWNVLKNAVKFTPANGLVTITAELTGDKTKVSVTDSGYGMTPSEADRIFDAFSQGDHLKSHRFGGLGLGLAICRKLVEFHGGEIRASSPGRDKGSTFIIELPRMDGKSVAAAAVPKSSPSKKMRASGRRILLVEDHEPTRVALSLLLSRRAYQVTGTNCVTEARLLAHKEKFDLVISDIGLPDGDGADLMRDLHSQYGLNGIALTGYGMEEDIARSMAAGFVTHLTKPVNMQSLEKALAIPALAR